MSQLIFNDVSLWPHHIELAEYAVSQQSCNSDVIFVSCNRTCPGCPANPLMIPILCVVCIQKSRLIHKTLSSYGVKALFLSDIPASYQHTELLPSFIEKIDNSVDATFAEYVNDSFFDKSASAYKKFLRKTHQSSISIINYVHSLLSCFPTIDEIIVWNGRRPAEQVISHCFSTLGFKTSSIITSQHANRFLYKEGWPDVNCLNFFKSQIESTLSSLSLSKYTESDIQLRDQYFNFASASISKPSDFSSKGFYNYSSNYTVSKSVSDHIDSIKTSSTRIILIAPGTFYEFMGLPEYSNDPLFPTHYDAISFLLSTSSLYPDVHFILRFHPNLSHVMGNEHSLLISLSQQLTSLTNWTVYSPSSNVSTYYLMQSCDAIISIGSSVAVEGLLYNKPVLFIGRNWFESLPSLVIPHSFYDVENFISDTPNPAIPADVDRDSICFAKVLFSSDSRPFLYFNHLSSIYVSSRLILLLDKFINSFLHRVKLFHRFLLQRLL